MRKSEGGSRKSKTAHRARPNSPPSDGWLEIIGARHNNLKNVDVSISRWARSPWSRASAAAARVRWSKTCSTTSWRGRCTGRGTLPGAHDDDPRRRADQQGDPRRSAAAGQHAHLEPGHLHRRVRTDPPAVRPAARGEAPRLHAAAVQLQRARAGGATKCEGNGQVCDRDALPARRVGRVRDVPRPALQPRDAGRPVPRPVDRRRAGHVVRRGGGAVREHPQDPPHPADAVRRGARLPDARPAGPDALRRRGPARQAGRRTLPARHGPDALPARRADHRPALRRPGQAARRAQPAGRPGQHGRGDRAQPRRDQDGRLDHRHGPRGGRATAGRSWPCGTPERSSSGMRKAERGRLLNDLIRPRRWRRCWPPGRTRSASVTTTWPPTRPGPGTSTSTTSARTSACRGKSTAGAGTPRTASPEPATRAAGTADPRPRSSAASRSWATAVDRCPTNWNHRTIVEIAGEKKTDGWFFHAITGERGW